MRKWWQTRLPMRTGFSALCLENADPWRARGCPADWRGASPGIWEGWMARRRVSFSPKRGLQMLLLAISVLLLSNPQDPSPAKTVSVGPADIAPTKSQVLPLFAATLDSLVSARDAARALKLSNDLSKDRLEISLEIMTAKRKAISNLERAKRRLGDQLKSDNELVAKAARFFVLIYTKLIAIFEEGLKLDERMADVKPGDKMGAFISELSNHGNEAEETWRTLAAAAATLAQLLVDDDRKEADGGARFLIVSTKERGALLEEISQKFGSEVAGGKIVGLHASEGSAGMLAYFLLQPWKSSDQK
jgi:hypothetical protein